MIESTQWSRKHQIAGLPVDQIRVVDMVPKGIQNYGLRLVANGRYVAFEMFRTRLDALIASTLFKELYRQKDSIDVCKVLGHFSSSDSDLNEWTVKQEAVQAMCDNIVTHLKQFMPQDSDQALLNQIEELRRQNAELTAQCKSQTENPPNPPSAPSAKAAGIGSFFAPPLVLPLPRPKLLPQRHPPANRVLLNNFVALKTNQQHSAHNLLRGMAKLRLMRGFANSFLRLSNLRLTHYVAT